MDVSDREELWDEIKAVEVENKQLRAENKQQADFLSLAKEEMDSLQTKNKQLHAKLIIAKADARLWRKRVIEAANAVEDFEDVQAENVTLRDILQSLADIQNGPHLIKDTKKWNAIMDEAYKILKGGK